MFADGHPALHWRNIARPNRKLQEFKQFYNEITSLAPQFFVCRRTHAASAVEFQLQVANCTYSVSDGGVDTDHDHFLYHHHHHQPRYSFQHYCAISTIHIHKPNQNDYPKTRRRDTRDTGRRIKRRTRQDTCWQWLLVVTDRRCLVMAPRGRHRWFPILSVTIVPAMVTIFPASRQFLRPST